MPRKIRQEGCCDPEPGGESCCSMESMVTVDERGQMVLPKEIREKAGIKPGDKLAVVSVMKNNEVCCLTLIKAEAFAGMVKVIIGPMMNDSTS